MNTTFSLCRRYRYILWREWAPGPHLMVIGLNPSVAGGVLMGEMYVNEDKINSLTNLELPNLSIEDSRPNRIEIQSFDRYTSRHVKEISKASLGVQMCVRCGQERSSRELTDGHRKILRMLTSPKGCKKSYVEGGQEHCGRICKHESFTGRGVGEDQGASLCNGVTSGEEASSGRKCSSQERKSPRQRNQQPGALDESSTMRTTSVGFGGICPADPSTLCATCCQPLSDETKDDPTIRKCIGFAKKNGYGSLCMTNLFAFRSTDPKDMIREANPIGPDNEDHLLECAHGAGAILAAWGKHGNFLNRAGRTAMLFPRLVCLGTNLDGSPRHPLYVPYTQNFIPFVQNPV